MSWYDWFSSRNFRQSFSDDHHAGGSFKHMQLFKKNKETATFVVLGYYGTDELHAMASLPQNKALSVEQFMTKYNKPFYALVELPMSTLAQPITTDLKCTFKFKKDLHGKSHRDLNTSWHYESSNNRIKITFDDYVVRNGKAEKNKWFSTDDVPYERDATLRNIYYKDGTLV